MLICGVKEAMSNKISTLCALGSVNLDLIIQTAKLPQAGETVTQGLFHSLPGGKGANTAFAAQQLGAEVSLVAMVGQDAYASEALKGVKKIGVNLQNILTHPTAPTGVAFINVSEEGENQIAVASGANMEFSAKDLPPLNYDAILTQFEIPVDTIAAAINGFNGFVAVNASPVTDEVVKVIPRADLIIVNQGEYEAFQEVFKDYQGFLAITLGAAGAVLRKGADIIAEAQPPKVDVVDTTGAGDAFAAALTIALMEGQSPSSALRFACIVGALTTTKIGTQTAAPHRQEVEALL